MDHRRFSFAMLDSLILEILSLVKPTEDDRRKRLNVIHEFNTVVGAVESLRGATVEPFGSFVCNLYTKWGDLDITVNLPNNSLTTPVGKNRKQSLLRDIMRALRRNGVRNLQFISKARVPLLTFQSNNQNVLCDISICNHLGHLKSKFLLWISEIDDRFRDMVLLVKEWAKANAINDPKTGTLNSYSLCLLVIFHFQTCIPAILPPLKDIYEGNIADDLTGTTFTFERSMRHICAGNMARFRSRSFSQVNRTSLSELFFSFFEKFSRIETLSTQYAICTYTGQWEMITSKAKWMEKNHRLIIEDPFEQPDNAARAVSMNGLIAISEALVTTYHMLSSPAVISDKNRLIAGLVRPHIFSRQRSRGYQGHSSTHNNGINHYLQIPGVIMSQNQDRFAQAQHIQSRPSSSTGTVQRHGAAQRQGHKQWRQRNS